MLSDCNLSELSYSVSKVIKSQRSQLAFLSLGIVSSEMQNCLNDPEKKQAKPEVHRYAKIQPLWHVAGSEREIWHKQEIGCIPRQHSYQGVDKIRHR